MCGDAELGVGGAIAPVAAPALDDLEKEAFAVIRAVKLKVLAIVIPVVEDIGGLQPAEEFTVEREAGFEVVVVVRRDLEG